MYSYIVYYIIIIYYLLYMLYIIYIYYILYSLVAQMVMNLPAMQETQVRSLDQEDSLEEGIATHSSILAWRIHGQKSLVDYSPWGHKKSDTAEQKT